MTSRIVRGMLAVLVLVLAGACTPEDAAERPPVAVTGKVGEPPTLSFDAPLTVTSTSSQVVWPGQGPELTAGGPVLLQMYGQDGRDHSVLTNTYAGSPRSFTLDDASLGAGLTAALRGQRVGARIVFEEQDGDVPVVLVVDVLPTRAYGEKVAPEDGFPTVTTDERGAPTVKIPASDPPGELAVQPLIRGDGPQVEAGYTMTVRYTGVAWSTGEVFDTNWAKASDPPLTVTAGVGNLVEGWEQGLLEQTAGSQVLIVVPPDLGYGGTSSPLANETLVYVVDILDVHAPVADSATDQPTDPATAHDPTTTTHDPESP